MNTSDFLPETNIASAVDHEEGDALDRALQDSFPASDAPSATAPTRIGAPASHHEWYTACDVEDLPARVARDRLRAHLSQGSASEQRGAVDCLVEMLSSRDAWRRRQGYALFRDELEDALFQSCINYGALVHGFTHPLLSVLEEAVEHWAAAPERPLSKTVASAAR